MTPLTKKDGVAGSARQAYEIWWSVASLERKWAQPHEQSSLQFSRITLVLVVQFPTARSFGANGPEGALHLLM